MPQQGYLFIDIAWLSRHVFSATVTLLKYVRVKRTKKVLSTKFRVDGIDQFAVIAERQGESKAALLKRLVLNHMNNGGKVDGADPL